MKNTSRRQICRQSVRVLSSLAASVALALPLAVSAQAVNFAGKTVEFVIPFGVGGGSVCPAALGARSDCRGGVGGGDLGRNRDDGSG